MKKLIALFTTIMITLSVLVGCGNKTTDKKADDQKKDEKVVLTIWHDLGDNGNKWFDELGKIYAKENPKVEIKAVNYATQQWIEKSIAAINTNSAPDLIFNNYERVIKVQNQTNQISDLSNALNAIKDKEFLTEEDLKISTYKDKKIMLPIQRVQMAFGVRKSWMEKVGAKFPETWEDALELAKKFTEEDPDGNGKNDTYGFALEAAKPRDLVHMLDLFTFGTGIKHTVVDPSGKLVINEERHKEITEEFVKVFTQYKYVPKDTINYTFTDMYQIIEGSKAGMFRVGDWNVKKWKEVLKDDYVLGPWPAFRDGDTRNVVIGGMRGIAVPENAANKEEATKFAQFMLTKEAQEASLKNVGSAVRSDLQVELTENQKFFAVPEYPLVAYDFPESVHSYYPEIEELYHKALLNVLADPSVNLDESLKKAEEDMQEVIDSNK